MPFPQITELVGTSPTPMKAMAQLAASVTTAPETFEDLGVDAGDVAAAPSILICPRDGDIEVDLVGQDLSAGEGLPIKQGEVAEINHPDTLVCKFISAGTVAVVIVPQEYTQ